ncbi:uncharacterized protein IWZ02DRAFT_312707 [Phyllosticta citriasiana]|uniref:uncharacterized protein n=1 Tax=Phyllosticta citriasiana TaxID=595635 RepID=UPI0030FD5F18
MRESSYCYHFLFTVSAELQHCPDFFDFSFSFSFLACAILVPFFCSWSSAFAISRLGSYRRPATARKSMTFSLLNALLSASITTTTTAPTTPPNHPPIIQTAPTDHKSARRNTSRTHPINQTIQSQPPIAPPVPPARQPTNFKIKNRDPRSEMKVFSLPFLPHPRADRSIRRPTTPGKREPHALSHARVPDESR